MRTADSNGIRHRACPGSACAFNGPLNLIFQPAEEGLARARRMLEDGMLTQFPCDAVFAMHNMPGFPTGKLAFRAGPFMASTDQVTVRGIGYGGHGAMLHKSATRSWSAPPSCSRCRPSCRATWRRSTWPSS